MLEIGDRVYHRKLKGNGIIKDIDETKSKDKYVVEFLWGKYVKAKHGAFDGFGSDNRKWQYCSEESLIPLPTMCNAMFTNPNEMVKNKVTMLGKRSLDRVIQNVCEIEPRHFRDNSDIIISYGHYKHRVSENLFVINRDLVSNKYAQCKLLGNLAPISLRYDPNRNDSWIAKPFCSMGGKDIYEIEDDTDPINPRTHYVQQKFDKVREFRTHCFLWMGQPVRSIQEKFIEDKSQLCWNEKQGSEFKCVYNVDIPNLPLSGTLSLEDVRVIQNLSIKALQRLNYDFGGVDIAMDREGNFAVFEVNSRMGVKEFSLFTYKIAFNTLKRINIEAYKERRWMPIELQETY